METKEIEQFLETEWNHKPLINNQTFNDLFQIEKIPLWWFSHKFFYFNVLPKPLNPFSLINKNQPLSLIQKIKFHLSSKLFQLYLQHTENKKLTTKKLKQPQFQKPKILLLSYTNQLQNNQVYRLENLIKEIKRDQKFQPFTLFADPLSNRNYQKIKRLNNLYQYCDKSLQQTAHHQAHQLHQQWTDLNETTKQQLFQKDNLCLWPYFKPAFNLFFSQDFLYFLILYYQILKKIIQTENIKAAVITGTSTLFEKNLIAAASQTNLPVIRIQHGINLKNLRHQDSVGNMKQAIFSDLAKKNFLERGFKKEEIVVVGPVIYDDIKKYISPIKLETKNILIITGPFIEGSIFGKAEYFKIISKLLQEINTIPNTRIAFKLHPRETHFTDYQKVTKPYKNATIYPANLTKNKFHELIQWCNVFVNFGSNAILEAMIIDRPILTINLTSPNFKHNYWIKNNPAIIEVHFQEDITPIIKKALLNEPKYQQKRKEIIDKYCGPVDGRAGQRVLKLIHDLVN